MATKKLQVAGLKGQDGVGISSIEQTTTSSASGGENIITATLTDDTKIEFKVMNGKDGADGQDGAPGPAGSDANVTSDNIKSALGYTPANEEKVSQLEGHIEDLEQGGNGGLDEEALEEYLNKNSQDIATLTINLGDTSYIYNGGTAVIIDIPDADNTSY